MKTLITLIFVLFIGVAAQANTSTSEVKVAAIEMGIVTTTNTAVAKKEVNKQATNKVARLYRRSNSRVKKALSFTTKRNRAKMA